LILTEERGGEQRRRGRWGRGRESERRGERRFGEGGRREGRLVGEREGRTVEVHLFNWLNRSVTFCLICRWV
jgi:hypothetical protein